MHAMAYRIVMIFVCLFFGWRSVRLGLGIAPDSAAYHFRVWQERPELKSELERALELDPRYTAAWIARGLAAETAGDRRSAEASLLHSAEIDATYLPRWTLANFYLRAGDSEKFWIWARQAAGIAYDPAALFQLCWRVSDDAREILDRAIPRSPAVRRVYFEFLVRTNRLDAAELLADEFSTEVDLMLRYCDAAIANGRPAAALKAWNAVGKQSALTLGRCFDWRAIRTVGAPVSIEGGLTVSLSGKQPESCDLAERYLALEPGARYRLQCDYRTRDLPPGSGLDWSIIDAKTGAEFGAMPAGAGSFEFSAPGGCDLARLRLRYRRPAGEVRAEGSAVFQNITIGRAG
jgi:tetratricopeptide (TPR) repeat protein